MLLTALVFFCCPVVPGNPAQIAVKATNSEVIATASHIPAEEAAPVKPDAPVPKAAVSATSANGSELMSTGDSGFSEMEPGYEAPIRPPTTNAYETAREREIWFGLMIVDHGTAGFDAWTTRRAIGGRYGVEGDPLERPFARSGAIYATTQVTPLIMDYVGYRMMRSRHTWIRKAWWVPQAASASVSLGAGLHNYSVVP